YARLRRAMAPGWGSCGGPLMYPHPQPLPTRGRGAYRVRRTNIESPSVTRGLDHASRILSDLRCRGISAFTRVFNALCPAMTRAVADFPIEIARRKSPHPSRPAFLSPKSLVLPREPAGGDAHDLLRVGDGGADHLRRAAVSFEDRKRALGGGGVDHVAEADAHVEDLEHLAVVDLGVALDEGKDGMRLDEPVDLVADRGGDAGEVEQAVAGDVDQRLHPGHLREDLHRLGNV